MEDIFSRRKSSGKNLTKKVKITQSTTGLSKRCREKDTSNWKSEVNSSLPVKTMRQKMKQKKRKETRTLNSDTIVVFLWKKKNLLCDFFVPVQWSLSNTDGKSIWIPNSILLFYFFFSSTLHCEICSMSVEMYVLNLFPSK